MNPSYEYWMVNVTHRKNIDKIERKGTQVIPTDEMVNPIVPGNIFMQEDCSLRRRKRNVITLIFPQERGTPPSIDNSTEMNPTVSGI